MPATAVEDVPYLLSNLFSTTRELGRGGYAAVFEADCWLSVKDQPGDTPFQGLSAQRHVAIKVLLRKYAPGDPHHKLFLKEAHALYGLSHPNIIKCYGLVQLPEACPHLTEADGRLGMVLEYAEGGSLHDAVSASQGRVTAGGRRPYTTLQALEWMLQAASALDHLHTQQPLVIHRDIKLENVLLFPCDTPAPDQQQGPAAAPPPTTSQSCNLPGQLSAGGRSPPVNLTTGHWKIKLADFGLHQTIGDDTAVYLRRRRDSQCTLSADCDVVPLSTGSFCSAQSPTEQVLATESLVVHQDSPPFTGKDVFFTLDEKGVARSVGAFLSPLSVRRRSSEVALRRLSQPQLPSHQLTGPGASPCRARAAHSASSTRGSESPLRAPRQRQPSSTQPAAHSARLHTVRPAGDDSCQEQGSAQHAAHRSPRSQLREGTRRRAISFRMPATVNALASHILSGGSTSRRQSFDATDTQLETTSSLLGDGSMSFSVNTVMSADDAQLSKQLNLLHGNDHSRRGHNNSSPHSGKSVHGNSGDLYRKSLHAALRQSAPLISSDAAQRDKSHGPRQPSRLVQSSPRLGHDHQFQAVFVLTGETGSMLYMPPEVFKRQPYSASCDVFSLGLLGWELMAGRTLMSLLTELDCATTRAFAVEVSAGYRPQRPRLCPESVWHLLTLCWDSDPVARPTAHQVKAELQRVLASLQSSANPDRVSGSRLSREKGVPPQPPVVTPQSHSCCRLA